MKISIIIPVYNSEKFLNKLLDSIIYQTFGDYEVIIINDGSTDNSLQIINRYEKANSKIKSKTIKNSGPGIARKKGFEMASGELLFFIDSDDFLPNKYVLGKIDEIYRNNQFDILFFNYIRKNKNKEKVTNAFFSNSIRTGVQDASYLYKHKVAPALWSKIFVRTKMKKEYFCEFNNYEDCYTTYRYLNNCNNFYYTKNVLYFANRDNQESISKKNDIKKVYDTIDLLKEIYNETKYKDAFINIIYDYYISSRRIVDKMNFTSEMKKKSINKCKELEQFFNIKDLLRLKMKIKDYMKYVYYFIKDFIDWEKV